MIAEEITDPTFDRGILLVNGVQWGTYGTEIFTAYEDSCFWGSHPITFWDIYSEPYGGYPANLPAPTGHGYIPPDTLKAFSTVVWVGNNYGGDLDVWYEAPVYSYLKNGGNVLLLTRMGQDFVYDALRSYLGIEWAENTTNTTRKATSVYSGLVDMPRVSTQSYNAVFDTSTVAGHSTVLFVQNNIFSTPRGLGVWADPPEGGSTRPDGGQFVFVSGRPYRYSHSEMAANCDFILSNMLGEPYDPAGIDDPEFKGTVRLAQNFPNPFLGTTRIFFNLPAEEHVLMSVYDVRGREVTRLLDARVEAGRHSLTWDGRTDDGYQASPGVYWYRMMAGGKSVTRRMVLLK
jgi:hypothetical protein